MRRSNYLIALGSGTFALIAAACSGNGSSAPPPRAAAMTCSQSDAGESFLLQATGNYSARDLAAASERETERSLREAGMLGGRFSYWRETVQRPPFEPPIELLCEALEFGSPEQAATFVRSRAEGPNPVPSINWPRDRLSAGKGEVRFAETTMPEGVAIAKRFAGTFEDGSARGKVEMLWLPLGRFVLVVSAGDRDGRVTTDDVAAVMARLYERTKPLAQ